MTIRIVTDSTSDLPTEIVKQHKISVVPVFINMDNHSYADGVEMSRQEFYKRLPGLKTPPTTSAPSVADFQKVYHKLIGEGASGIISIHIASSLSNASNSARLAAELFPDFPISIVDSGNLTLGTGLLAVTAAELAATGKTQKEIVERIQNQAKRTWSFALLETLEYLHRGGRLSIVQYQIGRILNIKPVLVMHEGVMKLEKAFTFRGAMKRTIEYVTQKLLPITKLAFVHAAALQKVDVLKQMASNFIPPGEILVGEVTPAIGVHVGPGGLGLVCVQEERL